jgi:hypothetical protein
MPNSGSIWPAANPTELKLKIEHDADVPAPLKRVSQQDLWG